MRFSTIAAVSAAVLAGSTVAVPVAAFDNDLAARNNDELLSRDVKGATTNAAQSTTPQKPTGQHTHVGSKKPSGQNDLYAADKEYKAAQAEYKKAEADLAGSRKEESLALNEMGFGGINNNFGAPTQSPHGTSKKSKSANAAHANANANTNSPGKHNSAGARRKSSRKSKTPIAGTAKKLTAEQLGQQGLSNARKEYQSADGEYHKAELQLANARKAEQHSLDEMGFNGINNNFGATPQKTVQQPTGSTTGKRSLDVDEILEELAARGFFDEDDELFARVPAVNTQTPVKSTTSSMSSHATSQSQSNFAQTNANSSGSKKRRPGTFGDGNRDGEKHRSSRTRLQGTTSTGAKTVSKIPVKPKLTADQQGQLDLSTARTGYQSAEAEYKKAQADLANARAGEQKALNEMGFGGINNNFGSRSLDIEELEALAARELYDEFDEVFARDMMEDAPRDLDVEEIMDIIARGYYGDYDEY